MDQICHWLAHRPLGVLLIVFLIILPILSYFLFHPLRIESDVRRGFAQRNGRSTHELKSFADFYNISYEGLDIWVILIKSKKGSNETDLTINSNLLNEVERLDQFIMNFSITADNTVLRVSDLEGSKLNYLFDWFKYTHELSMFFGDIDLSHPIGKAMGHEFFTGSHFFGVNDHFKENQTGPIETAKFMTLWYMSSAVTFDEKKKLELLQMELFKLSIADNFSDILSFQMYGDQVANAEMLRGTMFTVKLFVVGVVMMIVFMLYSFKHLEFKSQIIQTIAAVASPTIATATCFGILGWTGTPFNSIMCITPFLVMGIGVDDAFLLLHSWRRHSTVDNQKKRIRAVLLEIGPSMAITSVTNTLAFGIGMTSPTPQMSAFCLCTAIAVLLDLIFEFAIFVPIMVLTYRERVEKLPLRPSFSFFSWTKYVHVLLSKTGKVIAVTLTLLLYLSATIGVSQLVPSFDPSKTFPKDSELLVALRNFEIIQQEYAPINFVSRHMPDLRNETEVSEFFQMISRLENRDFCYGSNRTQLLLRDYINTMNSTNLTYEGIPKFLSDRMIADKKIIQFHRENNSVVMDGINYIVICKGSLDWNIRAGRIDQTRHIIDEYPQFNTTLFDYDSTIYDLIITVKYELFKAVLLTFVCMAIACGFMIPSLGAASIATVSMLSISYSLLGWLSIWGQDMDPVTMINVLMAIGFSVDFSAHVCYHYHIHRHQDIKMDKKEQIEQILKSVGRPMIEASLSTLICMLPLFFVPVYIIESFARTVCLVATFGLFHGIVIIPVVLSWLGSSRSPGDPNSQDILLTASP
ncbi:unnamed protein product [Auanema sp. JU1783]|nr:unnamed protein product [Auanema sp. JU1783]